MRQKCEKKCHSATVTHLRGLTCAKSVALGLKKCHSATVKGLIVKNGITRLSDRSGQQNKNRIDARQTCNMLRSRVWRR